MMNEGFSELLSPNDLSDSLVAGGLLEEIRDFSLLEGKRIGWNDPLDYCWIAKRVAESGVDADANVFGRGMRARRDSRIPGAYSWPQHCGH